METDKLLDPRTIPGYRWLSNGQSLFSGELLNLYNKLDNMFVQWAKEVEAKPYHFPTFISASDLNKLDYFRSFPHLVTIPVVLDNDPDKLKNFIAGTPVDAEGNIKLGELAATQNVLTPAACYHIYVELEKELAGKSLETARYITTKNTCFRREIEYVPLQRQWSFSMREIVCIGTANEVKDFLSGFQEKLTEFFKEIKLPIQWQNATDPFFNPKTNPKYLMQKLEPVKTEMIFKNHLAIGSINFHRNYFGEAFHINRAGEEAFSGCVAFGIERWLYTYLSQFGLSGAP